MSNYNNQYSSQIQQRKPKFSAMLQTPAFQKSLSNSMRDPKEIQKFTAAITSVVSTNPQIEECDASTILSAALCGHALGLPPSPQLGQYYLVPFKRKAKWENGAVVQPETTVATFVLGYKGYIQLAIRSGQYKRLNVLEIKEGELISWDPLTEEINIKIIEDEVQREHTETIGYYAWFKYVNGFEKALYWSKSKMIQHADKYSPAFSSAGDKNKVSYADYVAGNYDKKKDGWRYSSFWYQDFDGMAKKTMLRQLISKWGIMSVEMQSAYEADSHVINNDGTPDYNTTDMIDVPTNETSINETVAEPAPAEPQQTGSFSIDELTE